LIWEDVECDFDDVPLLDFIESSSFRRGMPTAKKVFEDPANAAVLERLVVNGVLHDTSDLDEKALRTCHIAGYIHAVQRDTETTYVFPTLLHRW
jgi:hypothetical protein